MTDVPPLATIYYNPVGGCNLCCRHCWLEVRLERPGDDPFSQRERLDHELTPEQYFRILDDAKPLGLRHVKFTGGEPFLRRDTIDMMEGTVAGELGVTVETNATLLDDKTIDRLARLRPRQVAVSLDSVEPEYHDRFRGAQGSHRRALNAVRGLVAAGCNVQVMASITPENLCDVDQLIDFACRLKVGSLKLLPVSPVGRGAAVHGKGGGLSARQVLDLYRRYCEDDRAPVCVRVEVPAAFRPLRSLKNTGRCRIRRLLGLLPGGEVSYCGIGMSHPELVMGNLLRDSLATLWGEHPLLVRVREDLPDRLDGVCSRCMMKALCLGVCRVEAYVTRGDFYAPNWFCDQALREGFFPNARLIESGRKKRPAPLQA